MKEKVENKRSPLEENKREKEKGEKRKNNYPIERAILVIKKPFDRSVSFRSHIHQKVLDLFECGLLSSDFSNINSLAIC